jgi:hypothetical protein
MEAARGMGAARSAGVVIPLVTLVSVMLNFRGNSGPERHAGAESRAPMRLEAGCLAFARAKADFSHAGTDSTGPYDVNAAFTSSEQHEWDIHAL